MITYDPKRWLYVLLSFPRSPVFRPLFLDVVLAGLYAAAVVWAEKRYPQIAVPLGPAILSLLGIILGLLLVFRTNTAYDRWWEGRRLWGQLVNVSRALARQLDALLARDASQAQRRERYATLLTRYPAALATHLRGTAGERHEPNELTTALVHEVHADIAAGRLPREAIVSLTPLLSAFDDICGACERIRKTPIPFSYSSYIKQFILLFALLIPFALARDFAYGTVIAEMFIFFSTMGIELLANEVEEPFGTDRNDLPLEDIGATIARDVRALLPS
ncbi:MAG TPA: bestrophin family ion channel [Gemmatimonadales bacterium]|nr:bestrophin family ion channel [Gemmatimonadales bacterium]